MSRREGEMTAALSVISILGRYEHFLVLFLRKEDTFSAFYDIYKHHHDVFSLVMHYGSREHNQPTLRPFRGNGKSGILKWISLSNDQMARKRRGLQIKYEPRDLRQSKVQLLVI
jgi:hypothetical protein